MTANRQLLEKAVIATVGVILLYALAVGLWFFRQDGEWKRARKAYETAKERFEKERRLIGRKAEFVAAYEEEKAQMPTFAADMATDTTWLEKMDDIAAKHNVFVSKRQAENETEADDVTELPVTAAWEGALESLVPFLHELENTSEGMFDISSLTFSPSNKKGYLKGSFTLTCAYMREE